MAGHTVTTLVRAYIAIVTGLALLMVVASMNGVWLMDLIIPMAVASGLCALLIFMGLHEPSRRRTCPRCGSNRVGPVEVNYGPRSVLESMRVMRCYRCGASWHTEA